MSVFNNQVVVITGGSDGIGKALVEQFLALGAKVATCGRSQDKLNQLQVQHPGASLFLKGVDVSKEQECEQFIADVISTWGQIDVLINNQYEGIDY
jgi:NADP-dependent 3-hydroxy acid dehydrogenase YdfG